jgi:tRNA dimethylallyltransferase
MPGLGGLPPIPPGQTVLIAGPTASGKSALAMRIAQDQGGVIVNADASQVYDCWRLITARPTPEDEARVAHALYGHVAFDASYSAGHWLREVNEVLNRQQRAIIVGGTGLYFSALTQGMADIPPTPPRVRARGDAMTLAALLDGLDGATRAGLDCDNRARVQRAWEVRTATGRTLPDWQRDTPPPVLPLVRAFPIVFDVDRDWLLQRIGRRFDAMLEQGALEEVASQLDRYDPALPAFRAIGVQELADHLRGKTTLDQARAAVTIATRRFAKRQRTWFRAKMRHWHRYLPDQAAFR